MNRSVNQSRLNQSKLNKTKNSSIIEEQDSIVQAWNDIEHIKKENKLLKDEIDIETKLVKNTSTAQISRIQKDEGNLSNIEKIQEQSANLAQQIEYESKKNKDLNLLITLQEEEIHENKLLLTKADGNALPQIISRQKQLEYQLEKIRSRSNESQAQINMYKEQLNSSRRERVIFSNVFKKLECDLKKKDDELKKFILEYIKEEQKKVQAEEQYQKTKQWAQKEIKKKQERYEEALFEIEDDLENEKVRIQETKQHHDHHNAFETEAQDAQSKAPIQESTMHTKMDESPTRAQRTTKRQQTTTIQNIEEEVEQYKFMFDKLKKETGFQSIDEFIEKYNSINEDNNNLYNSCNQKSDEIVELQKELQRLDLENCNYVQPSEDAQKGEFQDKKNSNQQDQYAKTFKQIKQVSTQNRKMDKDIRNINQKVEQLAKLINVPLPADGLNDKNSIKFISQIEQKIADIVNMSEFCNQEVKDIERKINNKNKQDINKEINECLDNIERNKEAERIKNRNDLEEVAFEAIRDFGKRRKNNK